MSETLNLPYRKGAQALVVNQNGKILLVQLNDYKDNEWNIPGGGREGDEIAEENILREINEELGISPENLTVLAESENKNVYEFPPEFQELDTEFTNTYKGQIKNQFIIQFDGDDNQVKLDTSELKNYTWVKPSDLKEYLMFDGQLESVQSLVDEYMTLKIKQETK